MGTAIASKLDDMQGFQLIINNYPYSYEGLVARWDYMATSLLMQGQGGGEVMEDFGFENLDFENMSNEYLNKLNEKVLLNAYPDNDEEYLNSSPSGRTGGATAGHL